MQHNDNKTDKFPFHYLPTSVSGSFRDALGCYRNDLMQAYATMCRATMQAAITDLGEGSRLKIYDQVEDIAGLAGIDDRVYRNIRNILFDTENKSLFDPEGLDRETAAVMLETLKEVLYQTYVRRAVLRQKLKMRRFFATQDDSALEDPVDDPKVEPITRHRRRR